uniref:Small ribosomal subunit protein bS20c n=1 Tax=Lophocladia kuetzingii TaxID=675577 RepID=A0A1Z1MNG7_9FLOR|nr:ribosomal protein S20 [Lophocladia kuetzingii]ARW67640.1 ribosomal protein S20 [Lophocladia kuetzingii]
MSQKSSNTTNVQINFRNRCKNKRYKLSIKTAVKKYLFSLQNFELNSSDIDICKQNLSLVYKRIDKAVKRKVLHKNTAARKKSHFAKMIQVNKI